MNPDRKVLELMHSMGKDTSKARPVTFYFYLPDQETAEIMGRKLRSMHFETDISESAGREDWLVLAHRVMVPEIEILEGLRKLFTPLVENLGGMYDGWETELLEE